MSDAHHSSSNLQRAGRKQNLNAYRKLIQTEQRKYDGSYCLFTVSAVLHTTSPDPQSGDDQHAAVDVDTSSPHGHRSRGPNKSRTITESVNTSASRSSVINVAVAAGLDCESSCASLASGMAGTVGTGTSVGDSAAQLPSSSSSRFLPLDRGSTERFIASTSSPSPLLITAATTSSITPAVPSAQYSVSSAASSSASSSSSPATALTIFPLTTSFPAAAVPSAIALPRAPESSAASLTSPMVPSRPPPQPSAADRFSTPSSASSFPATSQCSPPSVTSFPAISATSQCSPVSSPPPASVAPVLPSSASAGSKAAKADDPSALSLGSLVDTPVAPSLGASAPAASEFLADRTRSAKLTLSDSDSRSDSASPSSDCASASSRARAAAPPEPARALRAHSARKSVNARRFARDHSASSDEDGPAASESARSRRSSARSAVSESESAPSSRSRSDSESSEAEQGGVRARTLDPVDLLRSRAMYHSASSLTSRSSANPAKAKRKQLVSSRKSNAKPVGKKNHAAKPEMSFVVNRFGAVFGANPRSAPRIFPDAVLSSPFSSPGPSPSISRASCSSANLAAAALSGSWPSSSYVPKYQLDPLNAQELLQVISGGCVPLSSLLPHQRVESNQLLISTHDMFVSRNHFQVEERYGVYFIRDLGSLNGTYMRKCRYDFDPEHLLHPQRIAAAANAIGKLPAPPSLKRSLSDLTTTHHPGASSAAVTSPLSSPIPSGSMVTPQCLLLRSGIRILLGTTELMVASIQDASTYSAAPPPPPPHTAAAQAPVQQQCLQHQPPPYWRQTTLPTHNTGTSLVPAAAATAAAAAAALPCSSSSSSNSPSTATATTSSPAAFSSAPVVASAITVSSADHQPNCTTASSSDAAIAPSSGSQPLCTPSHRVAPPSASTGTSLALPSTGGPPRSLMPRANRFSLTSQGTVIDDSVILTADLLWSSADARPCSPLSPGTDASHLAGDVTLTIPSPAHSPSASSTTSARVPALPPLPSAVTSVSDPSVSTSPFRAERRPSAIVTERFLSEKRRSLTSTHPQPLAFAYDSAQTLSPPVICKSEVPAATAAGGIASSVRLLTVGPCSAADARGGSDMAVGRAGSSLAASTSTPFPANVSSAPHNPSSLSAAAAPAHASLCCGTVSLTIAPPTALAAVAASPVDPPSVLDEDSEFGVVLEFTSNNTRCRVEIGTGGGTIGKASNCFVPINDNSLRDQHARIFYSRADRRFYLQDLNLSLSHLSVSSLVVSPPPSLAETAPPTVQAGTSATGSVNSFPEPKPFQGFLVRLSPSGTYSAPFRLDEGDVIRIGHTEFRVDHRHVPPQCETASEADAHAATTAVPFNFSGRRRSNHWSDSMAVSATAAAAAFGGVGERCVSPLSSASATFLSPTASSVGSATALPVVSRADVCKTAPSLLPALPFSPPMSVLNSRPHCLVTFVAGDNVRPAQVLLSSAVHCSSPVATAPPTSHLRASGETCDTIADSEPVPSSPNVRKAAQVLQHLSRLTPDLPTTFGAGGSTRLLSVSSASGSPMSGLTGPGFVPSKAMVDNLGLQMILLDVGVTGDENFAYSEEMQDRYATVGAFGGPCNAYVGVFDGHGNRLVADFAACSVHHNMLQEMARMKFCRSQKAAAPVAPADRVLAASSAAATPTKAPVESQRSTPASLPPPSFPNCSSSSTCSPVVEYSDHFSLGDAMCFVSSDFSGSQRSLTGTEVAATDLVSFEELAVADCLRKAFSKTLLQLEGLGETSMFGGSTAVACVLYAPLLEFVPASSSQTPPSRSGATPSIPLPQLLWLRSLLSVFQLSNSGTFPISLAVPTGTDKSVLSGSLRLHLRLCVANLGDSKAMLCRGGTPMLLTMLHKQSNPEEDKRLGGARIVGTRLAVTRAFGDFGLVQFGLSTEPHVMDLALCSADSHLVVASDGLWDEVSEHEVAALLCDPQHAALCAKDLSRLLVDKAIARKQHDNISVIVVKLHPLLSYLLPPTPVDDTHPSPVSSSSSVPSSSRVNVRPTGKGTHPGTEALNSSPLVGLNSVFRPPGMLPVLPAAATSASSQRTLASMFDQPPSDAELDDTDGSLPCSVSIAPPASASVFTRPALSAFRFAVPALPSARPLVHRRDSPSPVSPGSDDGRGISSLTGLFAPP